VYHSEKGIAIHELPKTRLYTPCASFLLTKTVEQWGESCRRRKFFMRSTKAGANDAQQKERCINAALFC